MSKAQQLCVIAWCISQTLGLLCYNCSTTHVTSTHCAGDFSPIPQVFNDTAKGLVNCTGGAYDCTQETERGNCKHNAMCFVRSWRARAKYAWIVQRGCYEPKDGKDSLQKLLKTPTRAMTCAQRKLREAEYKVCLCRANWCNLAPSVVLYHYLPLFVAFITTIVYLLPF